MEYGKFNSAEELLKGYTELEKSFTQKCQELSALKQAEQKTQDSGTSGQPSPQVNNTQSTAVDVATVPAPQSADSNADCQSVNTNSATPPKVMTGGGNVSMALPNRPKTLREASELAKKYFN
ncbi:MAG: hypothetical protein J1G02_00510 [Clostridiales bacterium]|nr:hypothetical protein [Clostridiales bacterium]